MMGRMNYFAHAIPFLDDPRFAAGTAVPDWLCVSDRRTRLRARHLLPLTNDADPAVVSLARGIQQHLEDDARFHDSRAFFEVSLALTVAARDSLGGDAGFRPAFLGHLLTELLLDASLIAEDASRLDAYYRLLNAVDAEWIQQVVNSVAQRPAERLARFVTLFRRERILWDYLDDSRLVVRLNQIMRRVGLEVLPERFREILPGARMLVLARKEELLERTAARGSTNAA